MARSFAALIAVFAAAAFVGVSLARSHAGVLGSRTAVRAVDKSLPVPWMASPGKPRAPKPAYNKAACTTPLRKPMSWTGTWVDPAVMFGQKANFGRAGKPKAGPKPSNGKTAPGPKVLTKKPWTGNLASYTEKLVAKGKPYVAPSATKAASTNALRMQNSWIGSASDQLIGGTADAIKYLDNPQPKKKMWITSGDPLAPWKSVDASKAIPASTKKPLAEAAPAAPAEAAPAAAEAELGSA